MSVKPRLAIKAGVLAVLLCAVASAQTVKYFPGNAPDQRVQRTQERVEELYMAGNFERALLIYEKDLAPLGDKYAQYMVGYMYLNGQGVEVDKSAALAWYRIASERGEPVLVRARNDLTSAMNDGEIAQANRAYVGLWKSIGDTSLIMNLIRQDMNTLKQRTGSRIAASQGSGPAIVYKPTGQMAGPNFYRDIRLRLEARLTYIDAKVEISDVALQSEYDEIQSLENQVRQELAALGPP